MALASDEKGAVSELESTIRRVRSENKDYVEVWLARLSRADLRQKIAVWRSKQESPMSTDELHRALLAAESG